MVLLKKLTIAITATKIKKLSSYCCVISQKKKKYKFRNKQQGRCQRNLLLTSDFIYTLFISNSFVPVMQNDISKKKFVSRMINEIVDYCCKRKNCKQTSCIHCHSFSANNKGQVKNSEISEASKISEFFSRAF